MGRQALRGAPLAQRRCGALRRRRWGWAGSLGVKDPRSVRGGRRGGPGGGVGRGCTPSVICATHRSAAELCRSSVGALVQFRHSTAAVSVSCAQANGSLVLGIDRDLLAGRQPRTRHVVSSSPHFATLLPAPLGRAPVQFRHSAAAVSACCLGSQVD